MFTWNIKSQFDMEIVFVPVTDSDTNITIMQKFIEVFGGYVHVDMWPVFIEFKTPMPYCLVEGYAKMNVAPISDQTCIPAKRYSDNLLSMTEYHLEHLDLLERSIFPSTGWGYGGSVQSADSIPGVRTTPPVRSITNMAEAFTNAARRVRDQDVSIPAPPLEEANSVHEANSVYEAICDTPEDVSEETLEYMLINGGTTEAITAAIELAQNSPHITQAFMDFRGYLCRRRPLTPDQKIWAYEYIRRMRDGQDINTEMPLTTNRYTPVTLYSDETI